MQTDPPKAPRNDPAAPAARTLASGSAAIKSLASTRSGISVAATGDYDPGIGRVDFVLIDLTGDPLTNVVERKDVDYSGPPKHVAEAWTSSVALTLGAAYRVFFHVYDRTGVNLVAYDRCDFTCR